MANQILIKRSAVQSKVPATTDLTLGELGMNTYDGKLYLKKNNGVDAIVEIGPVYSVAGRTGNITLTTTDVAEGTNLYYTQARFDSAFSGKSTTNLSEGTNLYYTQARFDTAFAAKSTTNLAEGTNLYFTTARAQGTISVTGTGLSYGSGVITSNATSANTVSTIVARDASGNFTAGTITAALTGNASTATTLATGRTISITGDLTHTVTFDGSANVTAAGTLATVNGNVGTFGSTTTVPVVTANAKGLVTGVSSASIAFPVTSVAGRTGAVTLTSTDVSLANVVNSLQVINGGNAPSISSGTAASLPTASTVGRLYVASDTLVTYRDTGTAWVIVEPALTGDVTSATGSLSTVLATVNSNVGSFGSTSAIPVITVNAKGLVTAVSTASLGSMATQNNNGVTIIGGTINGTVLGNTTPAAATFTTATATTFTGALAGNASTATKLATARNISLTGDVTWTTSFDGSADVTAAATLANSGVTAGTYTGFVIDAKGRITSAQSTVLNGTANQIAMTGVVAGSTNTITASLVNNPVIPGLAGIKIPSGATTDRASTPTTGTTRFNTTTLRYEGFDGTNWVVMSFPASGAFGQMHGGNVAATSSSTTMAASTTTPTITDGTQVLTVSITPTASTSMFTFDMAGMVDSGTNSRTVSVALYRGSTCLAVTGVFVPTSGQLQAFSLKFVDSPATTSSITYTVRVGGSNGNTWYFGRGSSITYGGTPTVGWQLTEILL